MSDLRAWLDKLGAMSARDIRKLMRDEGILGIPGQAQRCPLAIFLMSKIPNADIRVGVGNVFHFQWSNDEPLISDDIPSPDSVAEFVREFDSLAYPELER